MAVLPIYALGREERAFVVPESTSAYGTAASLCGSGNAIRFKTIGINKKEDRKVRDDRKATRSPLATIVGRSNVDWSLGGYLLPSGAAGTGPDGWDDILKAAFGTQTLTGGVSAAYTLAKEYQNSFTLWRAFGNSATYALLSEMATGCVVQKLAFNLSSTDEAMISASGFAADVIRAGTSLSTTNATSTTLGVTTGDGSKFDAGCYVDVDADAGLLVSAVSGDNLTVPSTAMATNDAVVPSACTVSQTFVSTAVPISGILGSASLASASFELISAQIDIDTGAKPHNDKYGTALNTSYHFGTRLVTGSLQMRLSANNLLALAKCKSTSTRALSLVAGTAAGSIATFTLGQVIIDYTPIPSAPSDDIIVTLPFTAYGSSGEDEISLTLT